MGDRARSDRGGVGGVFSVVHQPGQGDLYLNPEIKSDLAAPGRHVAAGRVDGKSDRAIERRSPHRHDQLSGPVQPGHRRRGGIKPDLGHRSDAHDQYAGECEFVVPGRRATGRMGAGSLMNKALCTWS